MHFEPSLNFAQSLDDKDEFKNFKNQFHLPPEQLYFCGNSLGLSPKSTKDYLDKELKKWQEMAVLAHHEGDNPWLDFDNLVYEPLSNLLGAKKDELAVLGSLTNNLHQLMVSFYTPSKQRYKIIIEENAFPSDRYAVMSQLSFHNIDIKDGLVYFKPENNYYDINKLEKIIKNEGETIALVLLPGVQYYNGQVFDLQKITKLAHSVGACVGFDLAHSIGNVPINLNQSEADFAAWCSYKYLNSGPGGIAGIYINKKHILNKNLKRFNGWWGHQLQTRFLMPENFIPEDNARAWQQSNLPILNIACLQASLEIFKAAGYVHALYKKTKLLNNYLRFILQHFAGDKINIITPNEDNSYGAQVSLILNDDNGKKVHADLLANNIICDYREPSVIRLAAVPLYNSFADIYRLGEVFNSVI